MLESVVFQMLGGCEFDSFTTAQTVQLLAACPEMLMKFLVHLEARRPELMHSAV